MKENTRILLLEQKSNYLKRTHVHSVVSLFASDCNWIIECEKKILFTTTSSATIFNSWSTLLKTWTNKLIKSVQQTSVESIWKRDHTVSYFYILPNIRFDTVHSEVSVYRVRFSCWRVNVCWSNLNCIQMHLTDLRCDLQTKLFTVDLLRTSINQIVKQHFFVIQYQMLWSAQNCTQDSQIENCID